MTTALHAFIRAPPSSAVDAPPKTKEADDEGGEDSAPPSFLETLFVRTPIQAPSAAVVAAGGVDEPLTKEDIARQTAADPRTLLAAVMRARERPQNPHFAALGEAHEVPQPDATHHHHGAPCAPNEKLLQVTRYGRVYKRKQPAMYIHTIKPNSPPGMRYCRFCQDHRPLDEFYTHIKRYVCRKHHTQRVVRTQYARCSNDNGKVKDACSDAWAELSEARALFGYAAVNYDRSDMRALIIHAGVPWGLQPRMLPIDPAQPLRPRNVAIVARETFRMLVKLYEHTCSRALYIAHVQRCNLLPPHMDVGWPERPFHDPFYQRVDIDVGPLLQEEIAKGLGECVDRTHMEMLIASEPPAPWCGEGMPLPTLAAAMRARLQTAEKKKQARAKERAAAAKKAAAAAAAEAEEAAQQP